MPVVVTKRVAPREHDVVGLDVAVDYSLAVGIGQRVEQFGQNPNRLLHRELSLAREPVAK
jgi:hypothetical protein